MDFVKMKKIPNRLSSEERKKKEQRPSQDNNSGCLLGALLELIFDSFSCFTSN